MQQTQVENKRSRRRSRKTETSTAVQKQDMTDNEIYQLLEDETLTANEKEAKLLELVSLNPESAETVKTNKEMMAKMKSLIKEVYDEFAEHNKNSIQLATDNPLSELSSGIQEVFENYHSMNEGREDLKGTLQTVDELLRNLGGEDKLIAAMLEAKGKAKEISAVTEQLKIAKEAVEDAQTKARRVNTRMYETTDKLREAESGFMSMFRGTEIQILKEDLAGLEDKNDERMEVLQKANIKLKEQTSKLTVLRSSEDFAIHNQILAILDIGDESFKKKLSALGGVTLQYIDDTKRIMTGVRDQLEVLLTSVDSSLDVNINIRERMTILSSAMMKANDISVDRLKEFKENAENEESSLAQLENEKITRVADEYLSDLGDTMVSTGMLNADVQKIEVVIMSLRDQLKNGLLDSNEQLLISVTNATAGGMVMMNKAQTLGTLAQSVVAKGQYLKETEETYEDLAEQFRNGLAVRAGRNNTLDSMTDVLHTISESLEGTNDSSAELIADQRGLVLDLNDSVNRLKDAAETARSLQSSAKVGDYA